jgi:ABC-type multidrug transport system ATPase subunit/pSer/pThr/pTyr-binding forkhead associated (FHA) protein
MSATVEAPLRVWVCGSAPACDLVIAGPGIAARHCVLKQYPSGYALEDLGSPYGTFLNGKRLGVRDPEWVSSSDAIVLGPSTRLPWPVPSRSSVRMAPAAGTITIGRAPESTVVLDYPMISWNHARLRREGSRLVVEDLGSTNGTSVGRTGNRVQQAEVQPTDVVFFGSLKVPVSRLLDSHKLALGGEANQETVRLTGTQMVIGRDADCDYPLRYPTISGRHARLEKTAGGISIEDLGSKNGTFVDGQRISGKVPLKPGSEIALGSFRFRLIDDSGVLAKRSYQGNVTVSASQLVVEIQRGSVRRRLLDPVSLTVFPSELVALMGPAGAGKTTLLKALNGYTPPNAGQVLFNGEDLYANQDQFRLQVGYVPQDDILHPQLTVKEALYYTAKLRTDLRDDEIAARIQQVLQDLNIDDIGDRLIGSPERKVISGGQRKRVNIAMELLSDPSALFLDEPTSGLSSYDAAQVVRLLRRLADSGKTILCTIHQPSIDIFKDFDSLIMVARDKGDNAGALVYFGPAYPDSIAFFNPPRDGAAEPGAPEALMTGLAARRAVDWVTTYQQSRYNAEFIQARSGQIVSATGARSSRRRDFGFGQLVTLSRRNLLLKLRDRIQTAILLAQAPLFAALVSIVFFGMTDQQFTDPAAWAEFSGKVASAHFLMVVAAVWFGCNNAARDIVGETTIFQRERMVNLKLPSYVFSKIAVLAMLCLFQCVALLTIVYFLSDLSGSFLTLLAVLFTASLAGTALGLLISAVSPTTEAAIAFLPVVLLPFILLGGGIKPVHEMPAAARMISAVTPTRWAYEANFLEEARTRQSTFTNALEQQLLDCRAAVTQCQAAVAAPRPARTPPPPEAAPPVATAAVQDDIAASVFPVEKGRSTVAQSFGILATFFGVFVVGILTVLALKAPR